MRKDDDTTSEGSVIAHMSLGDAGGIRQAAVLIFAAWPNWEETIEEAEADSTGSSATS